MPNRSRKNQQKQRRRVQVLDDDGWTHVTTTHKKPGSRADAPLRVVPDALRPAEVPDGFTFEKLKDRYEWHRLHWQTSSTWDAVKRVLESELTKFTIPGRLENCVCIGLGSPSGLLRGGLVDRRSISLFQLAALATILDYISQSGTLPTISKCYAQDPVFNSQDKQLLNLLGFEVVQHPDAFSLVTERTLLYSPGAERTHLVQLLSKDPALFFGGPLDNGSPARNMYKTASPVLVLLDPESPTALLTRGHSDELGENALDEFVQKRHSTLLQEFEPNTYAFWKTSLYWKADDT